MAGERALQNPENMIAEYRDRGGNFIDTANVYTNGHSEKIIGDFLARSDTSRDRIVIGTKFFCSLFEGDPNGGGAGRKALMQQAESSLRRLQDGLHRHLLASSLGSQDAHRGNPARARRSRDLGRNRYIGLSDLPAWKVSEAQTIAHFRGWSPVIALQLEYSLLERTVEGELIPMAQSMGISVMPWSR